MCSFVTASETSGRTRRAVFGVFTALSYLLVSGVLAGCARHTRAVSKASRIDDAPEAILQPAD